MKSIKSWASIKSWVSKKQWKTRYTLVKTLCVSLAFSVVVATVMVSLALAVYLVVTRVFEIGININLTEVGDGMAALIALAGAIIQVSMLGAVIYMLHISLVDRSEEKEERAKKEIQRLKERQEDIDFRNGVLEWLNEELNQRKLAHELEVKRFEEMMKEIKEEREKREMEREKRDKEAKEEREKREKREMEREKRDKEAKEEREKREMERVQRREEERKERDERFEKIMLLISENNRRNRCRCRRRRG